MALTIGSISVDEDGEVSGSGLALEMFNASMAGVDADSKAKVAAGVAAFLGGLAEAIINHIKANAEIKLTITTGTSGLQRTPNPNVADAPTQAPAAPVVLTCTIT